jgi:hypothetical protein
MCAATKCVLQMLGQLPEVCCRGLKTSCIVDAFWPPDVSAAGFLSKAPVAALSSSFLPLPASLRYLLVVRRVRLPLCRPSAYHHPAFARILSKTPSVRFKHSCVCALRCCSLQIGNPSLPPQHGLSRRVGLQPPNMSIAPKSHYRDLPHQNQSTKTSTAPAMVATRANSWLQKFAIRPISTALGHRVTRPCPT